MEGEKQEDQKQRWLNSLENDLKSMGVKRWRKKAEDTSVWAVVLKEALGNCKDRVSAKARNVCI
jgi:hypothetical protein